MRAWLVSSRASIDQCNGMKEDSDLTSDSEDNISRNFLQQDITAGLTNAHGLCERVIMIPRLIVDPHKQSIATTAFDLTGCV